MQSLVVFELPACASRTSLRKQLWGASARSRTCVLTQRTFWSLSQGPGINIARIMVNGRNFEYATAIAALRFYSACLWAASLCARTSFRSANETARVDAFARRALVHRPSPSPSLSPSQSVLEGTARTAFLVLSLDSLTQRAHEKRKHPRYVSGEDPILGSTMVVPIVEGINQNVMSISKHYILK